MATPAAHSVEGQLSDCSYRDSGNAALKVRMYGGNHRLSHHQLKARSTGDVHVRTLAADSGDQSQPLLDYLICDASTTFSRALQSNATPSTVSGAHHKISRDMSIEHHATPISEMTARIVATRQQGMLLGPGPGAYRIVNKIVTMFAGPGTTS